MTSPLDIRAAVPGDIPVLHPLIERAYRGDSARLGWTHEADLVPGARTDRATLEAIVADPASRLLIAERDGHMIGCVHVADLGAARAYLGMLCVEPGLQGAGLGKRLIDAAETRAREAFHAARIEMTVIENRTELLAYYQRRGYAPTGEHRPFPVETDPPLRLVVLVKPLD